MHDDDIFDFSEGSIVTVKPAPAVVDDDAPVTVNYLGEVADLLEDARRIRKNAMRTDPKTGEERIHNPVMFEKAVARRQSILSAAVKLHRDLWSDHAQREFYRLMVAVIAKEAPEVAHRLIVELRKINSPILEVIEQ